MKSAAMLRQIELDDASAALLVISDLKVEDITLLQKFNPQQPHHVLSYASDTSLTFKMSDGIKCREVFIRWVIMRHNLLGRPIATMKADNVIDAETGKVEWRNKVFKLHFESEALPRLTHVHSGIGAELKRGCPFNAHYSFENFWCTGDAVAKIAPMRDLRIWTFFGKLETLFKGPLKPHLNQKSIHEQHEKDIVEINKEFRAAVSGVLTCGQHQQEIHSAAVELKKETEKVKMSHAREKALEAVHKTSKKRRVNTGAI